MTARPPTGNFGALVCEAVIPAGTSAASINGQTLPLPAWTLKQQPNIVVIGDTGCRIKQGGEDNDKSGTWNIQNCASPSDWPFQEVAEHAAAEKPDLVIHVGDYVYREAPCTGVQGCPGGPSGDTLATWEADFFTPARKLLLAAPWVFVRGNHEECKRAGDGWFTLLDPRPIGTCSDFTPPYLLQTNLANPVGGKLSLAVVDSSPALDAKCAPDDQKCAKKFSAQVSTFTGWFQTISAFHQQHAWMVTHKPVWSVKKGKGKGNLDVLNAALEAAWARERPQGIDLLLAGHTHVFEVIGFSSKSDHSMQLVIGNSGTKLAPVMNFNASDKAVRGAEIKDFRKIQDFGFTTLTAAGKTWSVKARDREGYTKISCEIAK